MRRIGLIATLAAVILLGFPACGDESVQPASTYVEPETRNKAPLADLIPTKKVLGETNSPPAYIRIDDASEEVIGFGSSFVLSGKVTTVEKQPIMGVSVSFYDSSQFESSSFGRWPPPIDESHGPGYLDYPFDPSHEVQSDSSGSYRLELLEPRRGVFVFSHPEFIHHEASVINAGEPGSQTTHVALERPEWSVEGRVLSERGNPIEGAYIGIFFGRPALSPSGPRGRYLKTDHHGGYSIEDLPGGLNSSVAFSVGLQGYLPEYGQFIQTDSATVERDFILKEARTLSIRIEDTHGQIIPKASVSLRSAGHPFFSSADSEGIATLTISPADNEIECRISMNGFLTKSQSFDTKADVIPTVRLERAPVFGGVVISSSGEPVTAAWLFFDGPKGRGEGQNGSCRSDDAGRFSHPISSPPVTSLTVRKTGYLRRTMDVSANDDFVEVELQPSESGIFGYVIGPDGSPVEHFSVGLRESERVRSPSRRGFYTGKGFYSHDGSFQLNDLPSGTFDLMARSQIPGQLDWKGTVNSISLRKGFLYGAVEVQLMKPGADQDP